MKQAVQIKDLYCLFVILAGFEPTSSEPESEILSIEL